MSELDTIKEKYKKKCEVVKKLNKKIIELEERIVRLRYRDIIRDIIIENKIRIFEDLTSHLDVHYYDINYKYDGKQHIEHKVESFGIKWLENSLLIHLARRKINLYSWDIKIISAKLLY